MTPSPLPQVLTLTLNPSVDVSYEIERLVEDRKIHADAYRLDPGGNGINVARALTRLRVPAHAVFVAAGETGALLERLVARQIAHPHPCRVAGETRINVTIEQRDPRAQYEVIGSGAAIGAEALAAIAAETVALADGGYVVLTGSLPPGVPVDTYDRLMRALHRSVRVVVDTHGETLARAVAAGPFLIKPNRYELEELVGRSLPTLDDVQREARMLQSRGVAHVCVSLGADGAVLADADGVRHARPPEVKVRSTVGAGDSMVAGLIAAFAAGADSDRALRLGLACGSATAAQPGTELFEGCEVGALADRVEVIGLEPPLAAGRVR